MRHYEIVILVHPDQSDQVVGMVERYIAQIKEEVVKSTVYKIGAVANWLTQLTKFIKRTTF